MKIGILQADSVLEQFQPEFGNYPDMFIEALSGASEKQLEFSVYDVEHGQYPASVNDCDGYIITGSRKSVYDDELWIHELNRYVVQLHEARAKLIGICFGHQMIAMALGGRTESASVGWGVGIHENSVIIDKSYTRPNLTSIAAIVSHKDQVTILPEDAELLATSEFCPNAMFQIDNHILAFQGHPEFRKSYSQALMDMRQDILGDETYTRGVESLAKELQNQTLAKWMLGFITS